MRKLKRAVLGLLLVLGLGLSPLSAQQCGPQGCDPATPYSQPVSPPSVIQPTNSAIPFSAVVRIHNSVAGSTSSGSGVYVEDGGCVFVLTCAHLFSDGTGQITVIYRNGITTKATLIAKDTTWDSAILRVSRAKGVTPAKLAEENPKAGAALTSCGYGSNGRLASNRGRFLRWASPGGTKVSDWLIMSGASRQGDSGGPIFNDRGRVAGVLWGATGNTVTGSGVGRLRLLIRSVAGKIAGTAAGAGRAVCPKSPQQPCPNDCEELRGQMQALQSRVAALEAALTAIQGTPGPRGLQGPQGIQGGQGISGINGVSPILSVDEITASVIENLPPIWFRKVDGRTGKELAPPEAVYLGEGFQFVVFPFPEE